MTEMLPVTTWRLWFGAKIDINTIHIYDLFTSEESITKPKATLCVPSTKGLNTRTLRLAWLLEGKGGKGMEATPNELVFKGSRRGHWEAPMNHISLQPWRRCLSRSSPGSCFQAHICTSACSASRGQRLSFSSMDHISCEQVILGNGSSAPSLYSERGGDAELATDNPA